MTFQKIHKPASSNLLTQKLTSPFAPRPFTLQARQKEEAENQAFEEHKFEATGLEMKAQVGTIAPEERQGLTALPAKMSQFWALRMERALRFGHNFAKIPVNHPKENSTGLPDRLKAGVEHLSGLSLDDVKVHQHSSEPGRLRAYAYTLGTDIHLATGQEQHLPHEAWHVVQQKQGRVKPTDLPAQAASINDDPSLEREADQMGAKASQAYLFAHVQKNDQSLVATSVQRQVVQRKKVPTNFGEFETTKFSEVKEGNGVDIILKFHPAENKVDAKKIALSQSVRATTSSGAAYSINPDQDTKMVASGKPGAGYAIDVPGTSNNPIYSPANLGPKEELKDTPPSENKTTAPTVLGVNTNYELGYCYKEKPTDAKKKKQSAGLVDQPMGGNIKGQSKLFETAAFAIEGTDKDKYYGSVKWGYKMEGTTTAPKVKKMDIELAAKGTPTANFIEPAKLWNVRRTQGTLRVAVDPAEVIKGDLSDPKTLTKGTLAKGTKLKQMATLMVGDDPAIQAEVLKADGTGSGEIVFIKNSDVEDMGGGSPTKKLPI